MNTYNVTNTSDSGAGALREAIALANTNLGTDNIVIDVDIVTLDTEIEITDSVSITGNGVVITQTVTRDNPGNDGEGASYSSSGGSITIIVTGKIELTEVTRFYQYEKGFHFYTADDNESSVIQERSANNELNYNYEGESFTALSSDLDSLTGEVIPEAEEVYRFFNNDTGAHLFTMDVNEKDYILDNLDNYTLEGVAYYAFEAPPENIETIPVYRMLNNQTGSHLLTSDRYEFESIQKNLPHFSVEAANGVAFYVMEI